MSESQPQNIPAEVEGAVNGEMKEQPKIDLECLNALAKKYLDIGVQKTNMFEFDDGFKKCHIGVLPPSPPKEVGEAQTVNLQCIHDFTKLYLDNGKKVIQIDQAFIEDFYKHNCITFNEPLQENMLASPDMSGFIGVQNNKFYINVYLLLVIIGLIFVYYKFFKA